MSKEKRLDKIEKDANKYEKEYHGCGRCVVRSIIENLDIGSYSLVKAAGPLAGGIAMRGQTCGALLGGLLLLGLETSSDKMIEIKPDDKSTLISLASGFNLCRKVEKEMGSTICNDIQEARLGRSFNIADPEEYKKFKEAGGYEECPKVVGEIAKMTAEMILEHKNSRT